jgi:peptidylprolyl isomerase
MKKTIIIWVIIIALFFEFLLVISPGDMKVTDVKAIPTQTIKLQGADSSSNNLVSPAPTEDLKGTVKIEDIKVGTGKEAKTGDTVVLHYRGTLLDGKEFDSSYKRGQPFSFTIGSGQVIKGWEEGIPGMKVGGKRKLTIPSNLGYGEQGAGADIPPNATLVFEVELLEIK